MNSLGQSLTGQANVCVGPGTMATDIMSGNCIAIGAAALSSATGGCQRNICIGTETMAGGGVGFGAGTSSNIAIGFQGMYNITTGAGNVGVGDSAMSNINGGTGNVGIGFMVAPSLVSGNNNVIIGAEADVNGGTQTNCIILGAEAQPASGLNNQIGIGLSAGVSQFTECYIDGISGVTVSSGVPVYINSSGQLGTVVSSRRYKTNIRPLADSWVEKIYSLRPVSFSYKTLPSEVNYGLIAEEVADVLPELVITDTKKEKEKGKEKEKTKTKIPETVRYHDLIPIMLHALQTQNRQIQKLEQQLAEAVQQK